MGFLDRSPANGKNCGGMRLKTAVRRAPHRMVLALALVFAFAGPLATRADAQICTKSWAAPVSGLWTDPVRWNPAGVPTAADDVCITVDGTYSVSVRGMQAANTVTVGPAGNIGVQTLAINGAGATATLTVAAGFVNAGILELQTITAAANVPSNLTVTAGTLTNSGTLRTLNDVFSGSGRTIAANLLNTGTVVIDTRTTFDKANGVYENQGSFTINASRTLNIQTNSGQIFRQTDGTLTVDGTMTLTGQTFEFSGGTVVGRPIIVAGALPLSSTNTPGFMSLDKIQPPFVRASCSKPHRTSR